MERKGLKEVGSGWGMKGRFGRVFNMLRQTSVSTACEQAPVVKEDITAVEACTGTYVASVERVRSIGTIQLRHDSMR